MADLKYYDDENARHPVLHKAKCTPAEAEEAIKRLWTKFAGRKALTELGYVITWKNPWTPSEHIKYPLVRFTSGSRHSRASMTRITLNRDVLTWLLVIHELAHSLDHLREKQGKRSSEHRWHSKHHARWVDRLAEYITAEGWPSGNLAHELALKEAGTRERAREASKPPERSARIAHKEALVARLEKKVKALTSRIKSHKRSIAALKRAEAKAGV